MKKYYQYIKKLLSFSNSNKNHELESELFAVKESIRNLLQITERQAYQLLQKYAQQISILERVVFDNQINNSFLDNSDSIISEKILSILTKQPTTYVLAIPFTKSTIILILKLIQIAEHNINILETPLTKKYIKPLLPANNDKFKLCSMKEMLEIKPEKTILITFPDHQISSYNTMYTTNFLGQQCFFSGIETVLLFNKDLTIYTTVLTNNKKYKAIEIENYKKTSESQPEQITQFITWLANNVEKMIQAIPEDVLSWRYIDSKTCRNYYYLHLKEIKILEGFLYTSELTGHITNALCNATIDKLKTLQTNLIFTHINKTENNNSTYKNKPLAHYIHPSNLPRITHNSFNYLLKVLRNNSSILANISLKKEREDTSSLKKVFKQILNFNDLEAVKTIKQYKDSKIKSSILKLQIPFMPHSTLVDFLKNKIVIKNRERLEQIIETNNPIIIFTPHYGDFVLGWMRLVIELTKYRNTSIFFDSPNINPNNRVYTELALTFSQKYNLKVLYNEGNSALKGLKALRNNGILGIMPDVYQLSTSSTYIPFLNQLAIAMTGTAFFAVKTKANIFPMYCYESENNNLELFIQEEINVPNTGNFEKDIYMTTLNIFNNIQQQLIKSPAHWVYWANYKNQLLPNISSKTSQSDWEQQLSVLQKLITSTKIKNVLSEFVKNTNSHNLL